MDPEISHLKLRVFTHRFRTIYDEIDSSNPNNPRNVLYSQKDFHKDVAQAIKEETEELIDETLLEKHIHEKIPEYFDTLKDLVTTIDIDVQVIDRKKLYRKKLELLRQMHEDAQKLNKNQFVWKYLWNIEPVTYCGYCAKDIENQEEIFDNLDLWHDIPGNESIRNSVFCSEKCRTIRNADYSDERQNDVRMID